MRTTVKTQSGGCAIVRHGEDSELVLITCKQQTLNGDRIVYLELTPDQAGALIFGIEQAAKAVTA